MIRENTSPCWEPTCDTCGEGDNGEYGGSFHYESREAAVKALEAINWTVHDDGKVECDECREERDRAPRTDQTKEDR